MNFANDVGHRSASETELGSDLLKRSSLRSIPDLLRLLSREAIQKLLVPPGSEADDKTRLLHKLSRRPNTWCILYGAPNRFDLRGSE